jgi:hypothetical protein
MLFVDAPGKLITPPAHTAAIGLKAGAVGLLTFMVVVAVQPLLLVNVIVLVPKLSAVTRPVFETVATAALLEVHALFAAAVPVPVSWEVVFGQITVFPDKVGFGETVTVT